MPLIPSFIERIALFDLNLGPGPFVDLVSGFSFHIISAALELDLLELLHDQPRTAEELAEAAGADPRGLAQLLPVLESLGYVARSGDRYRNTPMSDKWMLTSSEGGMREGFLYYSAVLREVWPNLHHSLRSGTPHTHFYQWLEHHPDTAAHYQRFMVALAEMILSELAGKLDLGPDCRRLLDIGGGHALYSVALCQRHPQLKVTILDSAYSHPIARTNIAAAGLQDRIELVEGDYSRGELGSGYDAALLFNVIHQQQADENLELVRRAAAALAPGGRLLVLDDLGASKPSRSFDHFSKLFSLICYHTLGAQNHDADAVTAWFEACGLIPGRPVHLRKTGMSLATGVKTTGAGPTDRAAGA